jgi:hypothetical protein
MVEGPVRPKAKKSHFQRKPELPETPAFQLSGAIRIGIGGLIPALYH